MALLRRVESKAATVRNPWGAAAGLLVVALAGGVVFGPSLSESPAVIAISPVGSTPSAIAVDPRSSHVFVTNSGDDTVSMLDARTGRVLRTIAVGGGPDQLAVNPRTERVFVVNDGADSVTVVDTRTGAVRATLTPGAGPGRAVASRTSDVFVFDGPPALEPGLSAASGVSALRCLVVVLDTPSGTRMQSFVFAPPGWGLAVDASTGRLFVPNPAQNTISLFDAPSGRLLRTVPVGAVPVDVAVDSLAGRAFVANQGGSSDLPGAAGSISVLDSHSGRVLRTVAVARDPALVAVDAPAGRVLVVHGWGGPGGADLDTRSHGIDVLDARTGAVLGTVAAGAIALEPLWPSTPLQVLAVEERRGRAFVLERPTGEQMVGWVSVLDDRRPRLLRILSVGPFPVVVAVDARAARLFVVHSYADCHTRSSVWEMVPTSVQRWLPFLPQAPHRAGSTCASHGSVTVFDLNRF